MKHYIPNFRGEIVELILDKNTTSTKLNKTIKIFRDTIHQWIKILEVWREVSAVVKLKTQQEQE